jgi:RNA polymerase sigma-70 factor (ECF subfamily)
VNDFFSRYHADMSDAVEAELGALLREGRLAEAATRAFDAYGEEVGGFLGNVLGAESDALEVLSQVTEDFWRGLPEFQAQCSVRTWIYVLARHAAARFRRSPWNRRERRTGDTQLDTLVAEVRAHSQPWLRTSVKDRFRALRESLDDDDRVLLVLRVDRDLQWKEIARVTLGGTPEGAALERESERLRKRFQLLKDELRRRMHEP